MNFHQSPTWISLATVLAFTCLATCASAAGGIDDDGNPRDVSPNNVGFDPPILFHSTVAATGWIAKGSGIQKLKGTGAVLAGDTFGVSGHSSPNILAWNCQSALSNGVVPQLPETITLTGKNSQVSLKIGGVGLGVGKSVRITAGKVSEIVVLATALQTVTFNGEKLKTIRIEDAIKEAPACVVAVDDIAVVPVP